MTRGLLRVAGLSAICLAMGACGGGGKSLSGDQLANDLVKTLHTNQFYKSAARAKCEPVSIKAGAISDCTVWFNKPIFNGDSTQKHSVRVTIDDDQGHFEYVVSG